MIAERMVEILTHLKVGGTRRFRAKIEANQQVRENVVDLIFEASTAVALQSAGFQVTMRESPDLHLARRDEEIFVEVKHFRRKRQDNIDDTRMSEALPRGELVPFGNTVPTESVESVQQVLDVLTRKAKVLVEGKPNLLAIGSNSSHCIDDITAQVAIARVTSMRMEEKTPALRRLNGILFLSPDYNAAQQRSTYFFPAAAPAVKLSDAAQAQIESIRIWQCEFLSD